MEEIFKDIEGYEGLYQVSNLGRVKSLDRIINRSNGSKMTIIGRILIPHFDGAGYLFVHLSKNNKGTPKNIHRLVGIVFIPNPNNKATINHINGDKLDNRSENLEWLTNKENSDHAFDLGLYGKGMTRYNAKLSDSDVELIRYGLKDLSQSQIAERFGIAQAGVSKIRLGKIWKHV